LALATAAETNLDEKLASNYVADLLHRALVESGEPQKASEAAKRANNPAVDLRLARVVLVSHPNRFTSSDRKWTLWSRFADPGRAFERNVEEIMAGYGQPIRVEDLARELGAIYQRSPEYYERVLERALTNPDLYFSAGEGYYGLRRWLLISDGETEEDVLFDNYLKPPAVEKYDKAAKKLDPSDPASVAAVLDAAGEPIENKALQYLAWRAAPQKFDASTFFSRMWRDQRTTFISSGHWIGPKLMARLEETFPKLAEREVDEYGENKPAETAEPLVINDKERAQLVAAVINSDQASRGAHLLETIFEVSPTDATYAGDLSTVVDALRSDERVIWVGADRFLPQGTIPEYVYSVPEILRFPAYHFTDAEGNDVDLLLEDDGFDGGLQREILLALAQDVLDEEPAYTPDGEAPATARCVLKFHHKEIGTFPLCQLPPGFFPIEAPILQVGLTLPTGHKIELWVNNETRLVYGLLDWYQTLPVDSGAVFYLERQAPDRYVLTYGEETEPAMFISRNRVNELLELGNRGQDDELPTFDVVREIMEHYRKGIEFLTLHTEVNIARRTTRRSVASLLSGYHCFFQRGGAWVFDAKKLTQGFDKSKRKYLKK
jgi:hypothetical protein